ncbi:hypothetical protein KIW84_035813 [Lathyrus oleraceus]|uniref:DUF7745 domain-containing protein n=1 Tax=Pisum sativum TaxID=3888 RepID=A0A9D4Y358_PEA|nr:hypothetical protein KIW84_035813 [Pisum sativum]
MLEEYAHLLGIHVFNKVPFGGLEEIPRSHVIAEALHLKKYEIDAHLVKKGGILWLTSEFLIGRATIFSQAGIMDTFEAILVLLIYGWVLFPNIDGFVDVNAIRIFLIGNPILNVFGDMYFSLHLRILKKSAFTENRQCLRWSQRLVSVTNDDIVWYDYVLGSLDIIDSCGEFSNVPLIGTQGGINYNLALVHRKLGLPLRDKPNNTQLKGLFYQEGKDPQLLKSRMVRAWCNVHRKGRSELSPCNCFSLEAYTIWVKKRALELKMSYAFERLMSVVMVESLTLPNQDVEELEDAHAKMKQERDLWEERFHALNQKHEKLHIDS